MSANVINLCPTCGGVCNQSLSFRGVLVCQDCKRALNLSVAKRVFEDDLHAEELSLP